MRNMAKGRNFDAKSHSFHVLEIYTSEILLTDRIHHTAVQYEFRRPGLGHFKEHRRLIFGIKALWN
jgi:hypothetical protein